MMMMMMKKMFLAVLLLQLLIQSTTGNPPGTRDAQTQMFKYGDILAFHREDLGLTYTHFAIYVDDIAKRFPEHKDKKGDLFHITGPFWGKVPVSDCVFGQMTDEVRTTMKVQNYLDTIDGLTDPITIGSEDDFTNRIKELLNKCPLWKPVTKNCEHLATYIRYGIYVSIQFNDSMEGWFHPYFSRDSRKLSKADTKKVISELHKLYDGKEDDEYYKLMIVSAKPGQAAAAPSG